MNQPKRFVIWYTENACPRVLMFEYPQNAAKFTRRAKGRIGEWSKERQQYVELPTATLATTEK